MFIILLNVFSLGGASVVLTIDMSNQLISPVTHPTVKRIKHHFILYDPAPFKTHSHSHYPYTYVEN